MGWAVEIRPIRGGSTRCGLGATPAACWVVCLLSDHDRWGVRGLIAGYADRVRCGVARRRCFGARTGDAVWHFSAVGFVSLDWWS